MVGFVFELKQPIKGNDKFDLAICYGFETREWERMDLELGDPEMPRDYLLILQNDEKFTCADNELDQKLHIVGTLFLDMDLYLTSDDELDLNNIIIETEIQCVFKYRYFDIDLSYDWDNKNIPIETWQGKKTIVSRLRRKINKLKRDMGDEFYSLISIYSMRRQIPVNVVDIDN